MLELDIMIDISEVRGYKGSKGINMTTFTVGRVKG